MIILVVHLLVQHIAIRHLYCEVSRGSERLTLLVVCMQNYIMNKQYCRTTCPTTRTTGVAAALVTPQEKRHFHLGARRVQDECVSRSDAQTRHCGTEPSK